MRRQNFDFAQSFNPKQKSLQVCYFSRHDLGKILQSCVSSYLRPGPGVSLVQYVGSTCVELRVGLPFGRRQRGEEEVEEEDGRILCKEFTLLLLLPLLLSLVASL